MNLHEYQAKELFARCGIPVLPGQSWPRPRRRRATAAQRDRRHGRDQGAGAGRRARQGGRRQARAARRTRRTRRRATILALTIKGLPVRKVLVTQAADIASETYAAIVLDRAARSCRSSCSRPRAASTSRRSRARRPRRSSSFHRPARPGCAPYAGARRVQPLFARARQAGARMAADILVQALPRVLGRATARSPRSTRSWSRRTGKVLALDAKVVARRQRAVPPRELEAMRDPAEETPGERWRARGGCPTCSSTATSAAS